MWGRQVKRFEMLSCLEGGASTYEFMTFAERSGMIAEVDLHVCRAALKRVMNDRALSGISLSVNLSGASLQSDDFVDALFQLLAKASGCSRRLICEITESARIADLERVGKVIERLRRHGFRVGLDDFGAGYSSYTYLKSLPVDYIKIDGSFIQNLGKDKVDQTIVSSICEIAKATNKKTIAEHVKDAETFRVLHNLGVHFGQGHYIGKPASRPATKKIAIPIRTVKRRRKAS